MLGPSQTEGRLVRKSVGLNRWLGETVGGAYCKRRLWCKEKFNRLSFLLKKTKVEHRTGTSNIRSSIGGGHGTVRPTLQLRFLKTWKRKGPFIPKVDKILTILVTSK